MSQSLILRRRVDHVPADPVAFWLGRLDADSVKAAGSAWNRWLRWLHTKPGWETVTPRELLIAELQAEDPYVILDLAQEYISSLIGRKASKEKSYWAVKSFFMHNRCALPVDSSFKIRGDRPPVEGKLTVPDIVEAYHAANIRYRSIIIFQWQSMLDNSRLLWANLHQTDRIVEEIRRGINPIRIDLPGRKENENDTRGRFYTFISTDTIEALRKYFEEERGWPKSGEPLWVQSNGRPLQKHVMACTWLRLFRRIGKVPHRVGPLGSRYGYNQHELRDVAASYLHVNAKAEGLDMDCLKLWCGQVGQIDPLRYDKFYRDTQYVTKQYLIAGKWLNIISNPYTPPQQNTEQVKNMEQRIDELTFAVRMLQDKSGYNAIMPSRQVANH